MGEYQGRINVPKDTMLHVVNNIFHKGVKESITKENILKMIPEIYTGNNNLLELIKILPYKSYETLEKLLEFVKEENDINEFEKQIKHEGIYYLEEAMIVVMKVKHSQYNYSLNPGVIENLKPLFYKDNKKLAKKYEEIERLTIGLLYTYGVVTIDFLRECICKYMNEIISEEYLYDFYFKRLNLNIFVNYYDVRWTDTKELEQFVTYLDEEEVNIGDIVVGKNSRNLDYKKFSKAEILKREEYLWNEKALELYDFIKKTNNNIYEYSTKRMMKQSELGANILNELLDECRFKNESQMDTFIQLYMDWYNNNPQYMLGGHTPNELVKKN